jgi:hypothetical protein
MEEEFTTKQPQSSPPGTTPVIHIHVPPQTTQANNGTASNPISNGTVGFAMNDANFVRLLRQVAQGSGMSLSGSAVATAFRNDDLTQLICTNCGNKIYKNSCSVDFTIRVTDERTQTAAIHCHNIICGTCFRTDSAKSSINQMLSRKSGYRPRSIAVGIVSCFAPLIRLCFGEAGVLNFTKFVDVILALVTVVLIGCVIYWGLIAK